MKYDTELDELIMTLVKDGGSDLHLVVGFFPSIRVNGDLTSLVRKYEIKAEDNVGFLRAMIGEKAFTNFVIKQEVDFSYTHRGEYRLRGNACFQKGFISIALRLVLKAKSIDDLSLPPVLKDFSNKREGFFLVVGPVGQGKSTTLTAMISHINKESKRHVITIEDPVEYLYDQDKSIIEQREVGVDADSFATALIHTFRQDVDVILIGEMRDRETIATAVTAAETGHLVLSTLHANSASQTIDRIIDVFPAEQQNQVRLQLSSSLVGILYQRLIPRVSGGMIPVCELLINTPAVANIIREKRTHEIDMLIETGSSEGMIDFDRHLADLVRRGEVLKDVAKTLARKKNMFDRLV